MTADRPLTGDELVSLLGWDYEDFKERCHQASPEALSRALELLRAGPQSPIPMSGAKVVRVMNGVRYLRATLESKTLIDRQGRPYAVRFRKPASLVLKDAVSRVVQWVCEFVTGPGSDP